MSVPFFAYWKNIFFLAFAFITCSVTLATDGLLGGRWTVDGGLEMLPAEGSLASPDAFRALRPGVVFASLASRHDPLPALRPLMLLSAMRHTEGGITSCLSQQCVPRRFSKIAFMMI